MLDRRQFFLGISSLDASDHLLLRQSVQCHPRHHLYKGQNRTSCGRVVAIRPAYFWTPKLGVIEEVVRKTSFHGTYKTVLAFDRSFVAMTSEDHNFCVAGYSLRGSASRQSN